MKSKYFFLTALAVFVAPTASYASSIFVTFGDGHIEKMKDNQVAQCPFAEFFIGQDRKAEVTDQDGRKSKLNPGDYSFPAHAGCMYKSIKALPPGHQDEFVPQPNKVKPVGPTEGEVCAVNIDLSESADRITIFEVPKGYERVTIKGKATNIFPRRFNMVFGEDFRTQTFSPPIKRDAEINPPERNERSYPNYVVFIDADGRSTATQKTITVHPFKSFNYELTVEVKGDPIIKTRFGEGGRLGQVGGDMLGYIGAVSARCIK